MFCPTCKGLMRPTPDGPMCARCGTKGKGQTISRPAEQRDIIVLGEKDDPALPKTDEFTCPECGHRDAWFRSQQTRKSDEPATIFLQCVKCRHRWRKY